jgi:hypothetical protein
MSDADDEFDTLLRELRKIGIELPNTSRTQFQHDLSVVLSQHAFMKGEEVSDMGPSMQFSLDGDKFNDTIRRLRAGGFTLPEGMSWAQFSKALRAAIGSTAGDDDEGDDDETAQFSTLSASREMSPADAKLFVSACERYRRNPGSIACPW